jgi:hypothetical protein
MTCASVMSVDPSSKSVTAEQMQMALAGVTRLNEVMFWTLDTVKEGRAAAAVKKLRGDVQDKLQMLIGQSDLVVEKLVGGIKSNRKNSEDELLSPAATEMLPQVTSPLSRPAQQSPTDTPASSPTLPSQPFSIGFIACTMLVLLQAWKKHEIARHPSAAHIFANLALASRKCLIYGCKDALIDENGEELFGVVLPDNSVSPPGATPLPHPSSANWREWAVVLQHVKLMESLTTGKVGEAVMTWMLAQLLTINTIKNDSQWLPEGFATCGYVFADFSISSSSEKSTSTSDNLVFHADVTAFDIAAADAAAASSRIVVASACDRDFIYADALGTEFRTVLLAGKSAVDLAVQTCSPMPVPLHQLAENLRSLSNSCHCVRFAIGMEEGPGRRRRRLKLITGCGDYSNAREARDTPSESGAKTSPDVAGAVAAADSNEEFAGLVPLGFSPTKKRPSLSMYVFNQNDD